MLIHSEYGVCGYTLSMVMYRCTVGTVGYSYAISIAEYWYTVGTMEYCYTLVDLRFLLHIVYFVSVWSIIWQAVENSNYQASIHETAY